ncbi:MAG: hypothetical protein MUP76_07330, partial [Acidimicrobiia bacterium]|nr:hypothetical protein [Acidimicrobiia bacterium]
LEAELDTLGFTRMVIWRSAIIALIVGTVWIQSINQLLATAGTPADTEADAVSLSNDSTSTLFDISGLKPGDQATRDITVTYTGSAEPVAVRVYLTPGDLTGSGLDRYLHLTVERGIAVAEGSGVGFAGSTIFSGTLEDFALRHTSYERGAGPWVADTPGARQTFRFTITLMDDNRAQGLDAGVAFTWGSQTIESTR